MSILILARASIGLVYVINGPAQSGIEKKETGIYVIEMRLFAIFKDV